MTGLGPFIANWVWLVVLLVAVTAGVIGRIHVEERALLRRLGDADRRYGGADERLVPMVW